VSWILLILAFSLSARAEEKALPYLGPGSDKLSKAEYERIYKNYIQTSILLDYPSLRGTPQAADRASIRFFARRAYLPIQCLETPRCKRA